MVYVALSSPCALFRFLFMNFTPLESIYCVQRTYGKTDVRIANNQRKQKERMIRIKSSKHCSSSSIRNTTKPYLFSARITANKFWLVGCSLLFCFVFLLSLSRFLHSLSSFACSLVFRSTFTFHLTHKQNAITSTKDLYD